MLYSDLKKMIAVCEMIRTGMAQARIEDFMDRVTRNTAEIMQVKACSIKIQDIERRTAAKHSKMSETAANLPKHGLQSAQAGRRAPGDRPAPSSCRGCGKHFKKYGSALPHPGREEERDAAGAREKPAGQRHPYRLHPADPTPIGPG